MSKEYTLKVFNTVTRKEETITVSKEVYLAYKRSHWNEEKDDQSFYKHEIQLSSLIGGDDNAYENFREFISEEMNPACLVEAVEAKQTLEQALKQLDQSERELIENIVMKKLLKESMLHIWVSRL